MIVQDQELSNWVITKVAVVSQINYLSQSLAFCSTLSNNCLLFSALLHNESHEFCANSTIIVLHYS